MAQKQHYERMALILTRKELEAFLSVYQKKEPSLPVKDVLADDEELVCYSFCDAQKQFFYINVLEAEFVGPVQFAPLYLPDGKANDMPVTKTITEDRYCIFIGQNWHICHLLHHPDELGDALAVFAETKAKYAGSSRMILTGSPMSDA